MNQLPDNLYQDIQTGIIDLLESARRTAARSVNALMTASYWEIGRRIVDFEQDGEGRAAYGEGLLKDLSAKLSTRFGRGFSVVNLQQMRNFYLYWPAEQIHQTPSAKSSGLVTIQATPAHSPDLQSLATHFPLPGLLTSDCFR